MTTAPTLSILPLTGHSMGCDRRAFVTLDGAPCMAGTMRAADEAAFVAAYYEINEAEVIILTESPVYPGCYSAAYDAGVKRAHRDGAYMVSYRIDYYTAEAQHAKADQIVFGDAGAVITAHYEAPKPRRVIRDGETLNMRLVRRDGAHVDIQTTIKFVRDGIVAPIAGGAKVSA